MLAKLPECELQVLDDDDDREFDRLFAPARLQIANERFLGLLFVNHPDHAAAALKGIPPCVIDSDVVPDWKPPEIPDPSTDPPSVMTPRRAPRVSEIIESACEYYGIMEPVFYSRRKDGIYIRCRQVAMWLATEMTAHSYSALGRMFKRDHTTFISNCRVMRERVQKYPEIRSEVEIIRRLVCRRIDNTPLSSLKEH